MIINHMVALKEEILNGPDFWSSVILSSFELRLSEYLDIRAYSFESECHNPQQQMNLPVFCFQLGLLPGLYFYKDEKFCFRMEN